MIGFPPCHNQQAAARLRLHRRIVRSLALCLTLLAGATPLAAETAAKLKLIYFSQRPVMSPAISGFYQQAATALRQHYFVASGDDLAGAGSPRLGDNLWVDSAQLLASHPQADLSLSEHQKQAGVAAGKMIVAVQRDLETLALDAAIIVDCKPAAEPGLVAGCGLYHYERPQGRITAASSRVFSVSIATADAWARPMVEHFVKGLNTIEERKVKRIVDSLSEEPAPSEAPPAESFVGVFGQIGFGMAQAKASPLIGVAFGSGHQRSKWTCEASAFNSAALVDGLSYREAGERFSVGLLGSSPMMHGVVWDLGVGIGWQENRLYEVDDESLRMRQSSVHLVTSPALRVPLSHLQQLHIRYDLGWRAPLSEASALVRAEPLASIYQGLSLAYLVVF